MLASRPQKASREYPEADLLAGMGFGRASGHPAAIGGTRETFVTIKRVSSREDSVHNHNSQIEDSIPEEAHSAMHEDMPLWIKCR